MPSTLGLEAYSSDKEKSMAELLKVKNLKTQFHTESGVVKAVDGISYHIDEREIIGLVGESGCGKSVSQLSVMQLISTPGKIVGGEVIFEGQDLLKYKTHGPEMRSVRGAKIAMIFQEPMTSLNPVLTINQQLTEMLELHLGMSKKAARERAIELLGMVGIPDAESRIDDYPHQFSGGMRQRVMIAIALSCNPKMPLKYSFSTAARNRASKSIGKHIIASIALMMTILITPPKYPAIIPSGIPMMPATVTDIKPTISAVLAP
ncbi:hypothetical protein ES708_28678 [subsurface metagenome]